MGARKRSICIHSLLRAAAGKVRRELSLFVSSGSMEEIATAIAAARGDLLVALGLGKVSIAERPEGRGAVRYDGSTHIFFDR